jgi:tRNA modification GTPase
VATGRGGAIAVVRVSGPRAIALCDRVFVARSGRPLSEAAGYTVHLGEISDGVEIVDEVLATVVRAPHSYTGEDSVEISCHASPYIENRIVQLLIAAGVRAAGPDRNGGNDSAGVSSPAGMSQVRMATPGEFTVRAFLAGKLDLAQAEAVADLIASSGRAQHSLAMGQLRGSVSSALAGLRSELIELAALLELELDFSEEDVEFASRERLRELAGRIAGETDSLAGSFALGNAIREGVPVAIVGRPNAGKSTLLNALAGDDRAMVSEIAGTTRDRIEEHVNIDGVDFRLIDTAGLRDTDDALERMGIDRALDAVAKAYIVLLVVDGRRAEGELLCTEHNFRADVAAQIADLGLRSDQRLCVVINKIDKISALPALDGTEVVALSAKTGENLDALRTWLSGAVDTSALEAGTAVISSARHYEALIRAREAIERVSAGLSSEVSADLLAEDVREVLHHLGMITGAVTSDDILGTIFSKFCIGK